MSSNPNTPFRSSLPTPGGFGPRKSIPSNVSTPNPNPNAIANANNANQSGGPRKSLLRTPSSSTNPETISTSNSGAQTPSRFITPKRTSMSASTTSSSYVTPSSTSTSTSSHQPPPVPPLPSTHSTLTSSTISSALKSKSNPDTNGARRGRQLEIGEEVMIMGSDLTGVIRHLGQVKFRPGHYAGLELTGDSVGKGKNDGSVQGEQYFATTPFNGMFCVASKVVALSSIPPTEATARPQSALSNRSSSRASDVFSDKENSTNTRPPSTTPGSSAKIRRTSVTPSQRSNSSMSNHRPSSSMSNRNSTMTPSGIRPHSSLGNSRPSSRTSVHTPSSSSATGPRKSLIGMPTGTGEEEEERKAKTSKERALESERKIKAGSRVNKFIGMKAKDFEEQRALNEDPTSTSSHSPSNQSEENDSQGRRSIRKGRPSSPLKETLLSKNPSSATAPGGLPRPRQSLSSMTGSRIGLGLGSNSNTTGITSGAAAGGIPTPKAAKGRSSMFSRSEMLPPTSAASPSKIGKGGNLSPSIGLGGLGLGIKPQARDVFPHPNADNSDYRNSKGGENQSQSDGDNLEPNSNEKSSEENQRPHSSTSSHDQSSSPKLFKERNRKLLEEMDLTPRRPNLKSSPNSNPTSLTSFNENNHNENGLGYDLGFNNNHANGQRAKTPSSANSNRSEFMVEPVVPLSLYEESMNELERLKLELQDLKSSAPSGKSSGNDQQETISKAEHESEIQSKEEELKRNQDASQEKILNLENQLKQLEEKSASIAESEKENQQSRMQKAQEEEQEEALKRSREDSLNSLKSQVDSLQSKIQDLEREKSKMKEESEEEIKELKTTVDDLRSSALEAMNLLDDDVRERQRSLDEADEKILQLEQQIEAMSKAGSIPNPNPDPNSVNAVTTAATIDNANLREQLNHAQNRIANLEDQLADHNLAVEQDRENSKKRKEKSTELENDLRSEIKRLKSDLETQKQSSSELKTKLDEVHEAFVESQNALENERAQVETLRADVENLETLGGSGNGSGSSPRPDEQILTLEKNHKLQIDKKDEELRELRKALEVARQQQQQPSSRNSIVTSPTSTSAPSQDTKPTPSPSLQSEPTFDRSPLLSIDSPRMSSDRDREHESSKRASIASNGSRNSRHSIGSMDPENVNKQISGLNFMIKQLNEEASTNKSKFRLMEQELKAQNSELMEKSTTLELVVKALTEDLAAKIKEEKKEVNDSEIQSVEQLVQSRTEAAKDSAKLENSILELKKEIETLKETLEKKNELINTLREEAADFEHFIAAQLHEKEALQSELKSVRKKLEKEKNRISNASSSNLSVSSFQSTNHQNVSPLVGKDRKSSVSSHKNQNVSDLTAATNNDNDAEVDDGCTLCGQNDHEVVNCHLFNRNKSEPSPAVKVPKNEVEEEEPCDDCGETGHTLEECPYAAEIF